MNIDDIDLTALTDDGDTIEIGERHRLRLRIEVDEVSSINDYESDGRVEWCNDRDPHAPRPDGFTGAAEKLWAPQNCGAFWWQPWDAKEWAALPDDVKRRERWRICRLMAFGFKQIGLELQEQITDSFSGEHWVEIATEWLSGVDGFYPEIVPDLAGQLPDIETDRKDNE